MTLSPDQFETYYHLTDHAKFEPSATKVPTDNALSIYPRESPGLYVADNVEPWWNGKQYHRAYVAEIKAPPGVAQDARWHGEKFIPGERMHEATVSRVMPTDAWVRETYGEPGWIESHHDTAFDTGEALPRGNHNTVGMYRGYHYDGPDARTFTPEQRIEHMTRVRAYRQEAR